MHREKSGFRGCWFGDNKHGIHLAAGPDWMHLVLEGLGKHLLTYLCAMLKEAGAGQQYYNCTTTLIRFLNTGHLRRVDSYLASMDRRTSACDLKRVANGLGAMTTISAMDLPGILLQAGIALGNHNSKKLPLRVTKKIQRVCYYFFSLQRFRCMRDKEGSVAEADVQV